MFFDLPLDVLKAILYRVRIRDLASLCRTSKTIYPYAKSALYRHITFTSPNVVKASFTLCSQPAIAAHAISLVLNGTGFENTLGTIQDILLLLPRLRTLILNIGPFASWILPQNQSSPFYLHTFECEFAYKKELHNFLVGQRELRRLHLRSCSSDVFISNFTPGDHLPRLISIFAPIHVVSHIACGRPIEEVTIVREKREPWEADKILNCLAHSTAQSGVVHLAASLTRIYAAMEHLPSWVPNLTHLSIDSCRQNPSAPAEALFPEWLDDLISRLPYLYIFKIQFDPARSTDNWEDIDFTDFVTMIFDASDSLDFVIITFRRKKHRYTCRGIPGRDWYICDDFESF